MNDSRIFSTRRRERPSALRSGGRFASLTGVILAATALLAGGAQAGSTSNATQSGAAINTVAGPGADAAGDTGVRTAAGLPLREPAGVATDAGGNLFISDTQNQVIRRVDAADGSVTTIAGAEGIAGFSGDGGPAAAARLSDPSQLAFDAAGDLYFVDGGNGIVRRIDAKTGIITSVAGSAAGNGQIAGLAVDAAGDVFVADSLHSLVRRVDALSGKITTVAGDGTHGYAGDGGPAVDAELAGPAGLAVDAAGNLYIADSLNSRVRRVDAASGTIKTVAGDGSYGAGADGLAATSVALSYLSGLAVDAAGNLFIADTGNSRVLRVDAASGVLTTLAGSGIRGFAGDGGAAAGAKLDAPTELAVTAGGAVYIADTGNSRIRLVSQAKTHPPDIEVSIAGTLGDNGWYVSNVTVTWVVSDPSAPILSESGCGSTTITADTKGTILTCTASSRGGTASKTVTIKRDATPPVATATVTPTPDGYGWNNSAVTVTFGGVDAVSGIAKCSLPVKVTTQGAGQVSPAGTCTDKAGNISAPVSATVNIDEGLPTVSIATPAAGAQYVVGSVVTAAYTCADALSGVATCVGSVANGAALDTTTPGSFKFTVTATDQAGNIAKSTVGYTVVPVVPKFSVSPSALAFGAQASGTPSAPQAVTVTNTGSDPVSIRSITFAGANPGQFSESTNCGPPLAVAGSCTINVVFVPGSGGAKSATMIVGGSGGAAAQSVTLSGTGVVPVYTVSPSALAFGNQQVGVSSAAQTVTVTNTGTVALPLTVIKIGGANPLQFAESNGCGSSVAVAASCTIGVSFTPTTVGAKTAVLIVNPAGTAATQTVALSGTGIVPVFSVTPSTLVFGDQAVGTVSAAQVVTVANTGNLPVTGLAITPGGRNPDQFGGSNTCSSSLAVGATCTISLYFKPTSTGPKTVVVSVTAAGGAATQTVTLTGTGIVPTFSVAPSTIAFGNQIVGTQSASQTVTVTNTGTLSVSGLSITLGSRNPDQFGGSTNCSATLAVGASCTISTYFKPTSAGAKTDVVTVAAAGGAASQTVTVTGTGVLGVPAFTVTPSTLVFGDQAVGTSSAAQVSTVTNTGTLALSGLHIAAGGRNPDQFGGSNTCSSTLAVGATCTISLYFKPTTTGDKTAIVTVAAAGAKSQTVTLTGTGIVPTFSVTPSTLVFGDQAVGTTSAAQVATVTNTGTLALSGLAITVGGRNPDQFGGSNTCSSTLAVGATCTISLYFEPTATGDKTVIVSVSAAGGAATQTVTLTGTGT